MNLIAMVRDRPLMGIIPDRLVLRANLVRLLPLARELGQAR